MPRGSPTLVAMPVASSRGTKRLPRHLAGKGMVLRVEEPRGALLQYVALITKDFQVGWPGS